VFSAIAAGASGFLLKNAPPESLVRAVRVIAGGDALLAPSVTRRLIEDFVRTRPRRDTSTLERLTDRERDVLVLLATGHVSSVLSKLGVRDRVQAVVYAYESGLVQPRT
jgi:DNA-binding NarL/FixJ family response regulator